MRDRAERRSRKAAIESGSAEHAARDGLQHARRRHAVDEAVEGAGENEVDGAADERAEGGGANGTETNER